MKKICIIKLGAKGDVVRTLSILPALKIKYPESQITWITKAEVSDLLQTHPLITKVLTITDKPNEKFNLIYNFDIEEEATSLASSIQADNKFGFFSEGGFPVAFNSGAEYYLNTLFDDELKRSNIKTYQEMMFEVAELPYNKDRFFIYLSEKDGLYAEDFVKNNNINKERLIGVHMGASPRWPSKAWSKEQVKDFVRKASQKNYQVLLFGGPDEKDTHDKMLQELKKEGIKFFHNNINNSNREFASLINLCRGIVCSDSFALHVATALGKPTVCLFFVTSPNEVESYGIIKKLISPFLYEYFPHRSDQFSEKLINSISADEVIKALNL